MAEPADQRTGAIAADPRPSRRSRRVRGTQTAPRARADGERIGVADAATLKPHTLMIYRLQCASTH